MASYDQMLTHYRMLGEQAQAQTDAQIRAQREAAALQSQRDAELFAQQQAQLGQQASLQAQRDQQLAGYQSQQQILAGQIGSARDYQGFQQQGALAGQQYEFTMQRDQQQAGIRAQEQVRQASLQEQLSQAQLNQREQMDMRRMEAAGAEVDQKVRGGYLTPEEGANLQMQIRTGLNPLRDRAMEADRLRSIVQTQQIEQQNQHQATLFAQRQQRVAAGAAGNIQTVYNPDTGRNERYMVDINTGALSPLESSSVEQARQLALLQGAQNYGQSAAEGPLRLQGMEANIAQSQAGTQATLGANRRADTLLPGSVEQQQLANRNLAQTMQFAAQMQPGRMDHQGLVNDSIVQALSQGADLHPGMRQLQGAQLADLTQRTRNAAEQQPGNMALLNANVQIAQQHAAQEPSRFSNAQAYQRAQTEALQASALLHNAQAATRGGIQPLSPSLVNTITNQISGPIQREVAAASQPGGTMPDWFVPPDIVRQPSGWTPELRRQGELTDLRRQATERTERLIAERINRLQGGNSQGGGNTQGGQGNAAPAQTIQQGVRQVATQLDQLATNNETRTAIAPLIELLGQENPDLSRVMPLAASLPPSLRQQINIPPALFSAMAEAVNRQQDQTRGNGETPAPTTVHQSRSAEGAAILNAMPQFTPPGSGAAQGAPASQPQFASGGPNRPMAQNQPPQAQPLVNSQEGVVAAQRALRSWYNSAEGVSRPAGAVASLIPGSVTQLVGEMHDLLAEASNAGRVLTNQEANRYRFLYEAISSRDPNFAQRIPRPTNADTQ